jgi:hypothetical protein
MNAQSGGMAAAVAADWLEYRVRALDALPAPTQAQGEAVEVFFWQHPKWPPTMTFTAATHFSDPGWVLVGSIPICATEGGGE